MSWFLMLVVGFSALFAMRYTPTHVDRVLIRVAGASFVASGTIGAGGWIGRMVTGVQSWVLEVSDQLGVAVFGAAITWIVVACAAGLWIGGMLPSKLFSFPMSDKLVFAGWFLPQLLTGVPGELGQGLRAVIFPTGEFMTTFMFGWI